MLFSELALYGNVDKFSASSFYNSELDNVNKQSIMLTIKGIQVREGLAEATKTYQQLAEALLYALGDGQILSVDKVLPSPMERLDYVSACLSAFEAPEKSAILFALAENIPLEDAVNLKRKDIRSVALTRTGKEVADKEVAHIRSPWVFWRSVGGVPCQLAKLPDRWEVMGPMTWTQFREAFNSRWK